MLIIISVWPQKAFKVLCSSQQQNRKIRKEISALLKRPADHDGALIWSSCRNYNISPYNNKQIIWFVFLLLIPDIHLIFYKVSCLTSNPMCKSFKFKRIFFVTFPSFTQISILHCLYKTLIKHTVFPQIISLAEDIVNGCICFFNFLLEI